MANQIFLPPDAENMINAMRALGYSFKTALADIIDNSVSASASRLDIITPPTAMEEQFLAILDNGCGMTQADLLAAMKHAGKSPKSVRSKDDLGRYGLGMKTASLSQCRDLIVLSKASDGIKGAGWSLDTIEKTQDWTLNTYSETECSIYPCVELLQTYDHGTLIIWKNFDNFGSLTDTYDALTEKLSDAVDHLGLVFHRLISDKKHPFSIYVNGREVPAKDPFLESRKGGADATPQEEIYLEGFEDPIKVKGYTLPHQNKMSSEQLHSLGVGEQTIHEAQGFYIYRGKRLIYWGDWLRLRRRAQASKLSRICVDVPNSMDKIWELDIKKSVAVPPKAVREKLAEYLTIMISKSLKIQSGKGYRIGKKENKNNLVWDANVLGKNRFAVRINKNSSIYQEIYSSMDDEQKRLFTAYTSMLEMYYPSRWVVSQYQEDISSAFSDNEDENNKNLIIQIAQSLRDNPELLSSILLSNAELADNVSLTAKILQELNGKNHD